MISIILGIFIGVSILYGIHVGKEVAKYWIDKHYKDENNEQASKQGK